MNQQGQKHLNIPILVIFTIFTVMIYYGYAHAEEYSMNTNLTSISKMTSKWSKQLSTGKLGPKAQEKMGEIMSNMSQVLQEMTGSVDSDICMQHYAKIETMKKEWKPFDTSGSD